MKSARIKYVRAAVAAVLSGLLSLEPALVSAGESSMWAERRKAMSAPARPQVDNPSDNVLASLPSIANPVLAGTGIKNTAAGLARLDLKGHVPDWIQTAVTPFATIQTASLNAGEKRPTVVLIQDAHLHNEAQHQNGATIEALGKEAKAQGGKLLVGLEGAAAGPIDLSGYRSDSPDVMKEIAWALEAASILSGAEAAAISNVGTPTGSSLIDLVGTEDFALYKANVNALRDAAPFEKSARAALSDLKRELVELKKKHFDANLIRFDSRKEAYEEGTLSLPDYALYLDSVVTATSPNLRDLIEAALIEGSLKFDRVEVERKKLLSELIPKLSDGELKGLLQASVMFRAGQLTYSAYYDSIKELAARHGLPLSKFPEMNVYIQYVLKSEAIDHRRLFEEVRELEGSVQQNLSSTDDQRAVLSLVSDYHLMNKLIDRALIESEWHAYEARRPDVDRILDRLAALGGGKPQSLVDMAPKWKAFDAFYDAALKRNTAMVANFAAAIEKSGTRDAVMVAGGFHSEGLSALLEKQNFNVLVLSPKITKQSDGPSSLEFLATGRLPLDELFSGQKLFLPTPMATAMNGTPTSPTGPAQILPPVSAAAVRLVVASRNGGQVKPENVDVGTARLQVAVGGAGRRGGNGGGTIDLPPLNDGLEVTISEQSNTGVVSQVTALFDRARDAIVGTPSQTAPSQNRGETALQNEAASELASADTTTAYMGWARGFGVFAMATVAIAGILTGLHIDLLSGASASLLLSLITAGLSIIAAAVVYRSANGRREKIISGFVGIAAILLAVTSSAFTGGAIASAVVLGLAATVLLTAAEESAHLFVARRQGDAGTRFSLSALGVTGVATNENKTFFAGQAAFFVLGLGLFMTGGALGLGAFVGTSGGLVIGLFATLALTLLNSESRSWRRALMSEGLSAIGIPVPQRIRNFFSTGFGNGLGKALLYATMIGATAAAVTSLFAAPMALAVGGAVAGVVGLSVGAYLAFVAFLNAFVRAFNGNPWGGVGIVGAGVALVAGSALFAFASLPLAGAAIPALILGGIAMLLVGERFPKNTVWARERSTVGTLAMASYAVGAVVLVFTGLFAMIATGPVAMTFVVSGLVGSAFSILVMGPAFSGLAWLQARREARAQAILEAPLQATALPEADVRGNYRILQKARANERRSPDKKFTIKEESLPATLRDAIGFYIALAAYNAQDPALARRFLRTMAAKLNATKGLDPAWIAFHNLAKDAMNTQAGKDVDLETLLKRLIGTRANGRLTEEQRTAVLAIWVLARRDDRQLALDAEDVITGTVRGEALKQTSLGKALANLNIRISPTGELKAYSLGTVIRATASVRNVRGFVASAIDQFRTGGAYYVRLNRVIAAIGNGAAGERRERYRQLGVDVMRQIGARMAEGLSSENSSRGSARDAGLARSLDALVQGALRGANRIADLAYPAIPRTEDRQRVINAARERYVNQLVGIMLRQTMGGASDADSVYDWFAGSLEPGNEALLRAKVYFDAAAPSARSRAATPKTEAEARTPALDELGTLGVTTSGLTEEEAQAILERTRTLDALANSFNTRTPDENVNTLRTGVRGKIKALISKSATMNNAAVAAGLGRILRDLPEETDMPGLASTLSSLANAIDQVSSATRDDTAVDLEPPAATETAADTTVEGRATEDESESVLPPTVTEADLAVQFLQDKKLLGWGDEVPANPVAAEKRLAEPGIDAAWRRLALVSEKPATPGLRDQILALRAAILNGTDAAGRSPIQILRAIAPLLELERKADPSDLFITAPISAVADAIRLSGAATTPARSVPTSRRSESRPVEKSVPTAVSQLQKRGIDTTDFTEAQAARLLEAITAIEGKNPPGATVPLIARAVGLARILSAMEADGSGLEAGQKEQFARTIARVQSVTSVDAFATELLSLLRQLHSFTQTSPGDAALRALFARSVQLATAAMADINGRIIVPEIGQGLNTDTMSDRRNGIAGAPIELVQLIGLSYSEDGNQTQYPAMVRTVKAVTPAAVAPTSGDRWTSQKGDRDRFVAQRQGQLLANKHTSVDVYEILSSVRGITPSRLDRLNTRAQYIEAIIELINRFDLGLSSRERNSLMTGLSALQVDARPSKISIEGARKIIADLKARIDGADNREAAQFLYGFARAQLRVAYAEPETTAKTEVVTASPGFDVLLAAFYGNQNAVPGVLVRGILAAAAQEGVPPVALAAGISAALRSVTGLEAAVEARIGRLLDAFEAADMTVDGNLRPALLQLVVGAMAATDAVTDIFVRAAGMDVVSGTPDVTNAGLVLNGILTLFGTNRLNTRIELVNGSEAPSKLSWVAREGKNVVIRISVPTIDAVQAQLQKTVPALATNRAEARRLAIQHLVLKEVAELVLGFTPDQLKSVPFADGRENPAGEAKVLFAALQKLVASRAQGKLPVSKEAPGAAFFDNVAQLPGILARRILAAMPLSAVGDLLASLDHLPADTAAVVSVLVSRIGARQPITDSHLIEVFSRILTGTGAATDLLIRAAGWRLEAPTDPQVVVGVASALGFNGNMDVQIVAGENTPPDLAAAHLDNGTLRVRVSAATIDAVAAALSEAATRAGNPLTPAAAQRLALESIVAHEIAELGSDVTLTHAELAALGISGDGAISRNNPPLTRADLFSRIRVAVAAKASPRTATTTLSTPGARAEALRVLIETGIAQPILRQIFDAIRSRNRDGNTFVLPNGRVSIEFDGQGSLTAASISALAQSEDATVAFRDFLSLKGAQIGAIESDGIQRTLGLGDATLEAFDSATSVDQAVRSLSAFLADPANTDKKKAVLTFSTEAEFRAKVVEFIAFAKAQTKPIDFNDRSPGDAVARAEAVLRALDAPGSRIRVIGLSLDESAAFAKSLDLSPSLLSRMRAEALAFTGVTTNRTVIFSARQLAMAQIEGVMQVMVLSLYQSVGDQIKAAAIVAIQA